MVNGTATQQPKVAFERCFHILLEQRLFSPPSNRALQPAVEALISNYNRALLAARVPLDMAKTGIWIMLLSQIASGDQARFLHIQSDPMFRSPVMDLAIDPLAIKIVQNAGDNNKDDNGLKGQGLQSILSGVITASWSAFEVLAGDLWEVFLNQRPRLAIMALGAEKNAATGDRVTIPQRLFWESGFNFAESMGRVARESRRWDFARRDDAERAYRAVLPKQRRQIAAIFQETSLKWLAATRNTILHNASIADSQFLKLVAAHPTLSLLGVGDTLPIDGALAGELSAAAFVQAKSLIILIDTWLTQNPK